jgi:hypothetical protein
MVAAVIERCAGIDVGRKFLAVCVMTGPANGEARSEIRQFGTTVPDLLQLRDWIEAEACTDVMMESTGSYWKPVFNILEGHTRGHGMVTPSFIPTRPIRELRDLTRRRRKLIPTATAEKNRNWRFPWNAEPPKGGCSPEWLPTIDPEVPGPRCPGA